VLNSINSRRVAVHIKYKGKMFAKAVNAVKRFPKRQYMDVRKMAEALGTSTYTVYAARRWLKEQEAKELNSYRDKQVATTKEAAAIMTNTQELVAEKGKVYGHPLENFNNIAWGWNALEKCKDDEVRVALGLIWLKMCRLIETPDHKDTIDDIAGYAETIHMIHAERKKRGG